METVHASCSIDAEQALHAFADFLFRLLKCGIAGCRALLSGLRREIVADGIGDDEVAVGQTLHERRGAEAIGAMVGEVGFAQHVQAGNVAHQIVVHPQSAHRVVHGRVNAHRPLIGIFARDVLIHFEEIAIALLDQRSARGA